MAINGSGIRDTARVLKINKNTLPLSGTRWLIPDEARAGQHLHRATIWKGCFGRCRLPGIKQLLILNYCRLSVESLLI